MTEWHYLGEWPPEPRAATEAAIAGLEWLVPAWCHEVCLRWNPQPESGGEDAAAGTYVSYEYRWASIRIHPEFFSDTPGERRKQLTHELLHVFVSPLSDCAEQLADRLLKEDQPKFHDAVRAEMLVRLESVVQDLARVIHDREAKR